ncbi:MAG TPA: FAD-dependent oxidoreductase [Burkholderiales bacterium]|nr:FAD-dependent oxidoreductase [Burkholderiales bacterium]
MQVDLLVAGAGAGGMAAALVGALEGLEVLLCEKSSQIGGTSATSAGTLWIPGNTQSRRAGFDDSADKARLYLERLVETAERRELREAFLATARSAIDYLEAKSEVGFVSAGRHPDYRELPGAAQAGRGLVAREFDARVLGADFARVRPPIDEFLLLGGMMVGKPDLPALLGRYRSPANFARSAKLVLRYAADRLKYTRGTRLTMGNALVARFFYSLRRKGVPILFDAPIEALLQENGRVAGALVRQGSGTLRVHARKGVVLATGGYGQNRALRAELMAEPAAAQARSMAHAGNTGDGLSLARGVGAALAGGRSGGLWTPASLTRRADGSQGLYPHFLLDRAKPGLIAVDSAGRRFVNEGCSYHDFVEAMFEAHKQAPAIPAWLICTEAFVRAYGLGVIYPGTHDLQRFEKDGSIVRAGSLKELARRIAVDPAGLLASVERYNQHAARGEDPDFHKGSTVLNRFNGDPAATHPCLAPIEQPPFVAQALWPADISVSTGLATDADARVLDADGAPIPGLYACGNDMASIFMGTYPGPGTTLGPAVTFGYRAAMHAAR